MAKPKVFISSTCYDLGQIRESLSTFVRNFGFEPILSEYGDVFYHPDLHTHDACIHEVGNCQMFILIIGGRFGGTYTKDLSKSITNAEHEAAIVKKIPVFTYIKKSVLDNHFLYQTNKDKPFALEIEYPAIEKQKDSSKIFDFINKVRKASVNNAYESFEFSKDIETHLRKQWAGMFFDFLKEREIVKQITSTKEVIDDIQSISNKLEDLVKNIYKKVDAENAEEKIHDIDTISLAREFLQEHIGDWNPGIIKASQQEIKRIMSIDPKKYTWYEYLCEIGILEKTNETEDEIFLFTPAHYQEDGSNFGYVGISVDKTGQLPYQLKREKLYNDGMKKINKEVRSRLLSNYLHIQPELE